MFAWVLLLLVIALAGWLHQEHRRIRGLSFAYFPLSWIGQSFALPLCALALLTFAGLVASEGDRPFSMPAALAAAVVFAAIQWRQVRTGRRLLEDVARRLGEAPATERVSLWSGATPWRLRRAGIERIRDIPYTDDAGFAERHFLDLYRSQTPPTSPRPILIQIHGGAWVYGRKDDQALPLLYEMADRGWLCVSVNYRLGPKARFPDMLHDILRAIAWVEQHATEYGGDPGFIALTGGSAGGHLSALAGLLAGRSDLPPGVSAGERPVAAVVPIYGRYDFLDRAGVWGRVRDELIAFKTDNVMPGPPDAHASLWDLVSPIEHVHGDAPPMLVVHGTHDTLISIEEARAFEAAVREAGSELEYFELEGAQHAFDAVNSALTQAFVQAVALYLETQRARTARSGRVHGGGPTRQSAGPADEAAAG